MFYESGVNQCREGEGGVGGAKVCDCDVFLQGTETGQISQGFKRETIEEVLEISDIANTASVKGRGMFVDGNERRIRLPRTDTSQTGANVELPDWPGLFWPV